MNFSGTLVGASALVAAASIAAEPTTPADPASFAAAPSMRVALARAAADGCEPRCAEWISAEGKIDWRTRLRFEAALKAAGSRRPPVLIHSKGGDVAEALAIGRLIRARGLDVAVARTDFPAAPEEAGASPPEARGFARSRRAICASACTLILAAGRRRTVGDGAAVGVHDIIVPEQTMAQTVRYYRLRKRREGKRTVRTEKVFVGEKSILRHIARSKPSPSVYRRMRVYLARMGVSRDLVDLMRSAPPESIRWLTAAELASSRLANDERAGETLAAFAPPPRPKGPSEDRILAAPPPPRLDATVAAGAVEARSRLDPLPLALVGFALLWLVGTLVAKAAGASGKSEVGGRE